LSFCGVAKEIFALDLKLEAQKKNYVEKVSYLWPHEHIERQAENCYSNITWYLWLLPFNSDDKAGYSSLVQNRDDLWDLLTSPSSLVGTFQANDRHCLNKKVDGVLKMISEDCTSTDLNKYLLMNTLTYPWIHISYTHTHTHTHTRTDSNILSFSHPLIHTHTHTHTYTDRQTWIHIFIFYICTQTHTLTHSYTHTHRLSYS